MHPIRFAQRGVATLAVAALLAATMLLAALYVNRQLLTEQRSAVQQMRSAQAFEAAEAGIDWALAQLADSRPSGPDCRALASGVSLRDRLIAWQPDTGRFTPADLRPACVRNAAGWSCACPEHGNGAPAADDDGAPHPGFSVTLLEGPRPGTVRVRAQGCSRFARPCATSAAARSEATAQVEVLAALLPAIARPPVAALTVRGGVTSSEALDVRVVATMTPRELFASIFGMDRATWRDQPAARRLACDAADCGDALRRAIGEGVAHPLIAIDGGLRLDGPLELGTPERPVVLVVDGPVQLRGAVTLHGVLHATRLRWDDTPPPGALERAQVRGAVVLDEGYSGSGKPELLRDTAVLDRLRRQQGSFVRAGGGWRDF